MVAMLIVIFGSAAAETPPLLQRYVDDAIESNLALKQREFSFERSVAALHEARGKFFPSVDIKARYTRAGGGREIIFPVGNIVNPMHDALNQLLGQQVFPANLENVITPFLREEEHDTRITATQPLIQPAILFNYKLHRHLRDVERAARDQYKRLLVAEVKSAYFNYLKAVKLTQILAQTEELLQENLRVSTRLVEAEKATKEVVYRAEAELSELEQQQAAAERGVDLAQSYFNFLLSRELQTPIDTIPSETLQLREESPLPQAQEQALSAREELRRLASAAAAAGAGVRIASTRFLPSLVLAADYGFQGTEYSFTDEDDFWTASLVLSWNLFNGFQDKAKLRQAKLDRREREVQLQELREQVKLQVRDAHHNLQVAQRSMAVARDIVESNRKSFAIVERKYREGMAPQIEYLDARNSLTKAELNLVITTYDYQIRYAEFERIVATYDIQREG
jgi:outer membrane protein TolC